VDWLAPANGECALSAQRVIVAASAPSGVATVRFAVDGKRAAVVRKSNQGVWTTSVSFGSRIGGRHTVLATAVDKHGRTASQRRIVRVCRG
jgi:hypothetical protein